MIMFEEMALLLLKTAFKWKISRKGLLELCKPGLLSGL